MTDVFISYKREERGKAQAIAEALVERGYQVWWDVELLPGAKFATEIASIIGQAKIAIVLWSKLSIESDFVRSEAELARNRDILVPVRVEECEIPLPFGAYHTLDLIKWTGRPNDPALLPLIEAIRARISPSGNLAVEAEAKASALHQADAEAELWREISSAEPQSAHEYELYLTRFGEGATFSELALLRIERLKKEAKSKDKVSLKTVVAGVTAIVALVAAFLGVVLQSQKIFDWHLPESPQKQTTTVSDHQSLAKPSDTKSSGTNPDSPDAALEVDSSKTVVPRKKAKTPELDKSNRAAVSATSARKKQAGATKEKGVKIIEVKATTGTLELVGDSSNLIHVVDAESGEKFGSLHRVEQTLKLPAGLYNLQYKDRLIQKNIEITASEVTKVTPALVKLQIPKAILYYILNSETGELLGSISGHSSHPDAIPAGRYDFAFGLKKKMLISAELTAGEVFVVPVGKLRIKGNHYEVVIKDFETDETLLGMAWNATSTVMLPGKYNYGVGVGYKLNLPFEIKAGETTVLSPGGVKIVPNDDYKIMSANGEHVANHHKLVGQTFLPSGDYSVLIGTTVVPFEVRDNQMVEIVVR